MPSAVDISRCPPTGCEIKSETNAAAPRESSENHENITKPSVKEALALSQSSNALHATVDLDKQAERPKELITDDHKDHTIFDKFLNLFSFAPIIQSGISSYADKNSKVKKLFTVAMSQMALFGSLTGLFLPGGTASKLGKIGYRGSIALGSVSNFLGALKMNNVPFAVLNVFKAAFSGNLPKLMGVNIPYLAVYAYTGLINGINNHLTSGMKGFMPAGGYKNLGDSFKVIGQQFARVGKAIKEHGPLGAFKLENTSSGIYGTVGGLVFQVGGFALKKIGEATKNPSLETLGGFLRGVVGNIAVELNRVDKETLEFGRKNEVSSGVWYTFEGLSDVLASITENLPLAAPLKESLKQRFEAALGAAGTIATLCYTVANNEENNADYRDTPIKANLTDITKVSLITGLSKMFPKALVDKLIKAKA